MVSLENSRSKTCQFPLPSTTPHSSRINRNVGRSMRTIRSRIFNNNDQENYSCNSSTQNDVVSEAENISDSVVDMRLTELTTKSTQSSSCTEHDFLELSYAFSDLSSCSSDVSCELQRLACMHVNRNINDDVQKDDDDQKEEEIVPCAGFLERESFSSGVIERICLEDLQPTVKLCVDGLSANSVAVKRSSAAKIRMLAKNRDDNRALIGECGAIPALIPLLRCSDALTQENAVTALLNLSLREGNKELISKAGGVKSLVYVLKTGTEIAKQNGACALLSLALVEENKGSIGACGAIPPLVSLLINGTSRGKKDALTSLYKLCSDKQNKERAVSAGAVKPLVGLVSEQGTGMAEKAMVVLNSLAGIKEGKDAIVEEGGIGALVEVIEDGTVKGKEFALSILMQLCSNSVSNRGFLVREGGIPPLVALSETGRARARHKAEKLLKYLREPRRDPSSSSS